MSYDTSGYFNPGVLISPWRIAPGNSRHIAEELPRQCEPVIITVFAFHHHCPSRRLDINQFGPILTIVSSSTPLR
jgi:hypothetical protein